MRPTKIRTKITFGPLKIKCQQKSNVYLWYNTVMLMQFFLQIVKLLNSHLNLVQCLSFSYCFQFWLLSFAIKFTLLMNILSTLILEQTKNKIFPYSHNIFKACFELRQTYPPFVIYLYSLTEVQLQKKHK